MPPPSTDKHLERLARALRRHRKANGQSLGALSRRTGLSKTSLMRLESGQANPSLETLWRVGHELGLTIAQLVEPPEPGDQRAVRPAGEGARVVSEAGMEGRLLDHDASDHRTEVFELTLAAHVRFGADAHDLGTTELVYCLAGSIDCGATMNR